MKSVAIGGALVVGSASLLSLGVLPILLGGLAEAGRLSAAGVGQAAMLETFGLALGAAVGAHRMGRGAMRAKTALAALALVAVNVATAHAGAAGLILLERAVAGLLAGLLLGTANTVIVRTSHPHRLSGAMLGLSTLPQMAAAYLMPVLIIPRFGLAAAFYVLAGGVLTAALCAGALPDRTAPLPRTDDGEGAISASLLLFAAAVFLQSAAIGAAWTYVERLAHQQHFAPSTIGVAAAASLGCQVAAAWLSAGLSARVRKWPVLLTLIALQAGFMMLAVTTAAPGAFITAVCVFGAVPAAMQPLQVAEVIALDPTRRAALLVGPAILVGNGLGPLLASFATTTADVTAGFWMAVSMSLAALGVYALCAVRSRLPAPRPA